MKSKLYPRCSMLATALAAFTQLSTLNLQLSTALAQGSAFTYQGRLNVNGAPASGSYDFRYRLAVDPYGNNHFGPTLLPSGQVISNGLFLATLDFGSGAFNGSNYWLEIAVRTNGAGAYTTLNPLQPVMPTPYAIFSGTSSSALNAAAAASATTATTATTVGPNGVNALAIQDSAVVSAKIASGQVVKSLTAGANTLYDNVTLAAGDNVTITPSGQTLTISGSASGWALTGNAGTAPAVDFIGTTDNQPVELHVNGRRALRLEPDSSGYDAPNVIGGSPVNFATSGVWGATIGGGGGRINGLVNSVTGNYGTVGGGSHNTAGNSGTVGGGDWNTAGYLATTGGGENNTASGSYATVGGGENNSATRGDATVSGGDANTASGGGATVTGGSGNTASGASATASGANNIASGNYATVSGGSANQATNRYATVPGGYGNLAGGVCSFAAGQGAQALHDGAFVWSDGTASTASTGNNQFVVRASGGVIIYSGSGPGGTVWTSANGGSGSGLDADTLDGLHASSFLNTGNDYGRSGVAADLYEGATKLGDKYLSKSGPGTISSGSSLQTLQVLNTGTGHGVYVESSTSTDNETALKAWVKGTTGNTFGIWGLTDSDAKDGNPGSSAGVYGKSTRIGPVGDVFGVLGEINGAGGAGAGPSLAAGVYGVSYAVSGLSVGVVGDSKSSDPSGAGVFGMNRSPTGDTRGVWGEVSSPTGYGVIGINSSHTGYGVYSNGRFEVAGSFTALADSWSTRSSRRWKTQIAPIEGALDIVKHLKGVHFAWKDSGKPDIGLIAEDVGEVIPEIVQYDENGRDAKSIDYGRIVSVLIEAVKEQQKEIDALRSELVTLKRK